MLVGVCKGGGEGGEWGRAFFFDLVVDWVDGNGFVVDHDLVRSRNGVGRFFYDKGDGLFGLGPGGAVGWCHC